jgi:hypothetical protein
MNFSADEASEIAIDTWRSSLVPLNISAQSGSLGFTGLGLIGSLDDQGLTLRGLPSGVEPWQIGLGFKPGTTAIAKPGDEPDSVIVGIRFGDTTCLLCGVVIDYAGMPVL